MKMAVASAYGEVILLFHHYQTIADNVVKSLFPGGKTSDNKPDQQSQ